MLKTGYHSPCSILLKVKKVARKLQFKELFEIQKKLNDRIVQEHNLDPSTLRSKKFLALLTEMGELANETRCFKYWSKKGPSPKEKILEEYVDCLHFILTIGIDFAYEDLVPECGEECEEDGGDLTSLFINLFVTVNELVICASKDSYKVLLDDFMSLGKKIGFTKEDIISAYLAKNEVNHLRQDKNY